MSCTTVLSGSATHAYPAAGTRVHTGRFRRRIRLSASDSRSPHRLPAIPSPTPRPIRINAPRDHRRGHPLVTDTSRVRNRRLRSNPLFIGASQHPRKGPAVPARPFRRWVDRAEKHVGGVGVGGVGKAARAGAPGPGSDIAGPGGHPHDRRRDEAPDTRQTPPRHSENTVLLNRRIISEIRKSDLC